MSNMDSIDIQVSASASSANTELDKLIVKLGAVQKSLSSIGGKSTNFGTKIKSQSNTATDGLNKMSVSMNKATKSTTSLASAFGSLYANFFWVIRGVKSLKSSLESTSDYIEDFNYYTVAFDKIASVWDSLYESYGSENAQKYTNAFVTQMNEELGKMSGIKLNLSADMESGTLSSSDSKNLALNLSEVTQYASQLASITNSVGQNGTISSTTSSVFTKLAGDISSLKNVDYSTVANNLQSGLIGQSRALYKYGIDITNATLQTYAYELGLEKAVSEMTQAEKMQLRMIAILDQSKVAWGDLADTINTPANMLRQWTNNLEEASMMLGQLFMPLLEKVLPVMNGITIALKNFLSNVAGFMGITIDLSSVGSGTSDVLEELEDITDGYESATSAAEEYKNQLLGFDEATKLQDTDTSSSSTSSSGSSIDLTNEILDAAAEYEKVWDEAFANMENKAQQFAEKFAVVFAPVEKLFNDIKIGDWFAVGEDTSNIVSGIFNLFSNAIASVDWHQVGQNIGLFLAGIDWTEVLSSAGRLIWEGLNGAIDLWKGSFETAPFETVFLSILALPGIVGFGSKIIELVTSPFKKIVKLLSPLITSISTPIKTMFEVWMSSSNTLGQSFMAVFGTGGIIAIALTTLGVGLAITYAKNEEVQESFKKAIDTIQNGLKPAIEFVTNTVLPDLQSAWERVQEILEPFADFLNNTFVSIWQDFLNPALTYLGETILPKLTSVFENLWNKVLVPLATFIGNVFEPIIQVISDTLTILWENIVVPLGNAIGNVLGKAFEGLVDICNKTVIPIVEGVIKVFSFLWDNVLSPIVDWLWDNLKPAFEIVFKAIGGIIDGLSKSFGGVIDFIAGVFTLDWKRAWNGVKDIFKGVFNGLISIVEGAINLIVVNGINNFLKGFNGVVTKIGDVIGLDISIPQIKKVSIPRYEVGGFPEDGLFFANHNELVGQFSNGKTAVANNEQIVAGIKAGVREAVAEVLAPYLADIAESNREVANKDFTVASRDVFNAVRTESNNYTRRTGKPAFVY